jgi:hypothetical protein
MYQELEWFLNRNSTTEKFFVVLLRLPASSLPMVEIIIP